jgi:hypothetical protein
VNTKVAANLFRGMEAVGGHLFFEEDEMIFRSHRLNLQVGETHIPYKDISNVVKCNTLLVVPNGILVNMKNGNPYQFVVGKRNEIISLINNQIHRAV